MLLRLLFWPNRRNARNFRFLNFRLLQAPAVLALILFAADLHGATGGSISATVRDLAVLELLHWNRQGRAAYRWFTVACLRACSSSYSCRSASIGCTPAARRAGIQQEASATNSNSKTPEQRVSGS